MEPEPQGVALEALDDAIRHVNRLHAMASSVPTLANRATHLAALEAGLGGMVAMITAIRPYDPPTELPPPEEED
ncbi:MAG TPA: hypothetical protein VKZ82_28505 [Nonomuraea sp.]|nr:hypothetical protein [Nonomuraea sp.]